MEGGHTSNSHRLEGIGERFEGIYLFYVLMDFVQAQIFLGDGHFLIRNPDQFSESWSCTMDRGRIVR